MPLDPTALVAVADLKQAMGGLAGDNKDEALARAINAASATLQQYLGRVLCDGSLAAPYARREYHTLNFSTAELWLMDWPIVSLVSVHEDAARVHDAGNLLTEGADFVVDKANGRLIRLSSGGALTPWTTGAEAIRVEAVLGYRPQSGLPSTALPVPADIADVCLWIAARIFQEGEQRRWDVQSATDPTGTVTRFSAARLPQFQQDRLVNYRARTATGRRAA